MRGTNAFVLLGLAAWFCLCPALVLLDALSDPGLKEARIPRAAWRLHRGLTPRIERWARARREAGKSSVSDSVPATEWPLFGAVFYLWSTVSLQEAWEAQERGNQEPRAAARGAVEAAADLVADPDQAAWVRARWGPGYLSKENAFYRLLLIAALTSREQLVRDGRDRTRLKALADGLAADIDASPHGLLDDYPDECYPTDVLSALEALRRAWSVLGEERPAFLRRSLRAFEGKLADRLGLVPYSADSKTGSILRPSRGTGNSYASLSAPFLWPEASKRWYDAYERHFWQERWGMAGFREFPRGKLDWFADVDSGPVLAGFGTAASAFGLGAARVNGRFDHAYPLAAQMLVVSWPLPGGSLLWPRTLSDAADAPFLGEAALLYALTRLPAPGVAARGGGRLPPLVYGGLAAYLAAGLLLAGLAVRLLWNSRSGDPPRAGLQASLWAALLLAGLACAALWRGDAGVVLLLAAQLLPRGGAP